MFKVFHKILSLSIALVVLFSTTSFTVDMHYCGDILVDFAVLKKARDCGMEMQNTSTKDCSMTKKNCCNDKQIFFDGQDELKISFHTLSIEQQQFVASFIYTYFNLFEGFDENINYYQGYKPPLVIRQIYKIDETYLI